MPPAFVVVYVSLMLFGPHVAIFVAAAAVLTPAFVFARTPHDQMLVDTGILVVATESAGFAFQWTGGVPGVFDWPWQAVPIAAAVVAYHLVQGALAEIVVPLVSRRSIDRSWFARSLSGCPIYLLGAGVAAALVEVIDAG